METVVKNIKQHSFKVDNIEELKTIAKLYTTVKNYVYSRYSGINSLLLLQGYKKNIRDIWVKTDFASGWKLPARYWKMALDETISNIKTEWSNTKLRVKKAVLQNPNITDDEKHFILYVLKANMLLHSILTYKAFEMPDIIKGLDIREKYMFNLIRRYIRKYKGSIPYSHKSSSFMIDADMYEYRTKDGKLFIYIQGLKRGLRIEAGLKDQNYHSGNLRIVLKCNSIEIHKAKYIQVKKDEKAKEKIIGIDKGYRSMIATSENGFYGSKLNEILSKETERLNGVNSQRNRYRALMKKYEDEGDIKKAENIKRFNLGKVKYNRNKNRFDAVVISYINREINRFIKEEKPTEVVIEDLTFVSWDKKFPAHVKRKLSRWIKGYIQERISYKCSLNCITETKVNAAYTSLVCHNCGKFGERKGEIFLCPSCGKMDADLNASENIKLRKYDKEINLYTPYKKVKEILINRLTA